MTEKIEEPRPRTIGRDPSRREFLKIAAAASLAGSGVFSARPLWAATNGKAMSLKLRQDLVPDGIMDNLILGRLNAKVKSLDVRSSYVNSDLGWGHEAARALEAPSWYSEGEPCDFFLARGPALAQLADAGRIAPLDEWIDASEKMPRTDFHRGVYGSVLDAATYRGALWGIPLIATPYALFCNLDLFEAGGVSGFPITWEEAVVAAEMMTRDLNGDGKPDTFGYSQCSFQFPLELATTGLDFVDLKNKRVSFDGDAGLEALDVYRRLSANSPPHVSFENGDMGMKISVSTNAFGRYSGIRHAITRLPELRRRANTYGDSDGIVAFAVSADASREKREAAWKTIELLTGERMHSSFEQMFRNSPLRLSVLNGDAYRNYLEKAPQMKPFVEELEWCIPKPCIPEFRFLDVIMREILYVVQLSEDRRTVTEKEMRDWLKKQADRANEVLAKATWG